MLIVCDSVQDFIYKKRLLDCSRVSRGQGGPLRGGGFIVGSRNLTCLQVSLALERLLRATVERLLRATVERLLRAP
jgi:hypothetical protein